MTDFDQQAIQRCRAWIGPEHRGLTNDEIRDTLMYQGTRMVLAVDALKASILAAFVGQARALADALKARPTPPEDQ